MSELNKAQNSSNLLYGDAAAFQAAVVARARKRLLVGVRIVYARPWLLIVSTEYLEVTNFITICKHG